MKNEVKPSEEEVRSFNSVRIGYTVRVSQKLIGFLVGGAFVFALVGAGTGISNAVATFNLRAEQMRRDAKAIESDRAQKAFNKGVMDWIQAREEEEATIPKSK